MSATHGHNLPLAGGEEPGAGLAVPGAVGVSGQAALGTVGPVQLAPLEAQLGHAHLAGHVQLLLWRRVFTHIKTSQPSRTESSSNHLET